jgi:hypothetical protein
LREVIEVKLIEVDGLTYGLVPVEMLRRAADIVARNVQISEMDEQGESNWLDWTEIDDAYSQFVHDLVDYLEGGE